MLFTLKMWLMRTCALPITLKLRKYEELPLKFGSWMVNYSKKAKILSYKIRVWRREFVSAYYRDAHALEKMVERSPYKSKHFPRIRDFCLRQIYDENAVPLYYGTQTKRTTYKIQYRDTHFFVVYSHKDDLIVTFLTEEMVKRTLSHKSGSRIVFRKPTKSTQQGSGGR